MTTTQQNLTYPYGTTPEEVIRERIANVIEGGVELHMIAADPNDGSSWMIFDSDALITVLGDRAPYFLRIQLLAALGVTEQ